MGKENGPKGLGIPDAHCLSRRCRSRRRGPDWPWEPAPAKDLRCNRSEQEPIVVRLNGDVLRGRTGIDGSNHLVQEGLPWRQGKVTRQLHHVVDTAVVDSCRTRCQSARSDLPCNALLAVVKSDGRRVQELRIDCVGLFADTLISDVEVVQQNLSPMGSVRRQHRCSRCSCTATTSRSPSCR